MDINPTDIELCVEVAKQSASDAGTSLAIARLLNSVGGIVIGVVSFSSGIAMGMLSNKLIQRIKEKLIRKQR